MSWFRREVERVKGMTGARERATGLLECWQIELKEWKLSRSGDRRQKEKQLRLVLAEDSL
jgi:hypothetical protein